MFLLPLLFYSYFASRYCKFIRDTNILYKTEKTVWVFLYDAQAVGFSICTPCGSIHFRQLYKCLFIFFYYISFFTIYQYKIIIHYNKNIILQINCFYHLHLLSIQYLVLNPLVLSFWQQVFQHVFVHTF